jgi:hypothetical protein
MPRRVKFNRIKVPAIYRFVGENEKISKLKKISTNRRIILSQFFEFLGKNSTFGFAHYSFEALFLSFGESLKYLKLINRFGASMSLMIRHSWRTHNHLLF